MWRLVDNDASLCLAHLTARVSPDNPGLGLQNIVFDGSRLPARVLRVHLPDSPRIDSPAPHYVREADLVARYVQTAERACSWQVYWSAIDIASWNASGIELIVSAETESLDGRASLQVTSRIEAADIAGWASGDKVCFLPAESSATAPAGEEGETFPAVLFRCSQSGVSYLEMADPIVDVGQTLTPENRGDGAAVSSWSLFGQSLEKGVIRRIRFRGLFLPSDNDQTAAKALFEQFLQAAPPLTT